MGIRLTLLAARTLLPLLVYALPELAPTVRTSISAPPR
jgi:hypothetical protein